MPRTLTDRSALATRVGGLELVSAVMTASGTSGHGAELAAYGQLSELGAVVVKSLAAFAWPGNAGLRVHRAAGGSMLNRVGLQGPGVAVWRERDLPALLEHSATVVASIWGRSPDELAAAARALRGALGVAAVEVNISCPNLSGHVLGDSARAAAEALDAVSSTLGDAGVPLWAKLSPAAPDICEIAGAVLRAGASALTLVNTLPAMWIDTEGREAPFAGGLSGPALHPVALRAVHDCRRAFPDAPIVGVGGVSSGADAAALLRAGADAVQVGTATFADPRASWRVQEELARWCARHRTTVEEVRAGARG